MYHNLFIYNKVLFIFSYKLKKSNNNNTKNTFNPDLLFFDLYEYIFLNWDLVLGIVVLLP